VGRRDLILQLLRRAARPRSITEIADELDVHPNTVRFHLDTLLRDRRVEQLRAASGARGRPPVLYRAARTMDPAGPTNYRLLAGMLAGQLTESSARPRQAARQLGRRYGARLVPTARRTSRAESLRSLRATLDELGFAPEPPRSTRDDEINLRHCPFLELVAERGEVICALHLGLMQGVLGSMQAPVTVDRLEPFAQPDRCIAHLTAR
jgi:predicted ArsR family transcriptional regulator